MGTAAISRFDCLASPSGGCFACSERCPVPGAIRLDAGRPIVVAEHCTGCGTCQAVCPAPVNAVRITPAKRGTA